MTSFVVVWVLSWGASLVVFSIGLSWLPGFSGSGVSGTVVVVFEKHAGRSPSRDAYIPLPPPLEWEIVVCGVSSCISFGIGRGLLNWVVVREGVKQIGRSPSSAD